MSRFICETERLYIRLATVDDAPLIHALWTDPRVMRFVGFPNGLTDSLESISSRISKSGSSEFSQLLIVERKDNHEVIGQCKMDLPDADGISETDVKLLPEHWGRGYGVEVKRALVDYLFTHTDCRSVQATPNVENIASIKMQEAVGGTRISEGIYEFPESMKSFTIPVHYYVYQVTRETWNKEK